MGGEAVRSSRVMHAARAAIEKTMTRLDDSITFAGALARVRRAKSRLRHRPSAYSSAHTLDAFLAPHSSACLVSGPRAPLLPPPVLVSRLESS